MMPGLRPTTGIDRFVLEDGPVKEADIGYQMSRAVDR